MQCTRILSNGLRTCKERLNARWGSIPSLLSTRHGAARTVLCADEEASHGGSTEGAEFPRGHILVSITPVGQPHRMAENRIVQVVSPTTPGLQVSIGRTVRYNRESRPFRHRLEDAQGEVHLDHNVSLDLRLCAFRLHHPPKTISDRHEYERKLFEILHSQARLGQGYHIYTSDGFVR